MPLNAGHHVHKGNTHQQFVMQKTGHHIRPSASSHTIYCSYNQANQVSTRG